MHRLNFQNSSSFATALALLTILLPLSAAAQESETGATPNDLVPEQPSEPTVATTSDPALTTPDPALTTPDPALTTPDPALTTPDPALRIEETLAGFPEEPSLHSLSQAALLQADADRATTESWLRAPARASILPELKLVAEHDFERDESIDRAWDTPDRWGADTDRDFGFLISASWKLQHLVFHPDQLRVHRTLTERASRREEILSLLIGYYYERRRLLLLQQLAPPQNEHDAIDLVIRIDELTASIDALTGGLLSRTLEDGNFSKR